MTVLTSLQVGSVLSYVIAVLVPALDAVFPVLPSETTIIALGVATAGSTDPRIGLLVACCALGAFLGDNLSYLLGRRFGPWAERRFFPGEKGARRRAWAERSLRRYGMPLIVVCRFVPGGRTAVTLCCGIVGYPRRRRGHAPRSVRSKKPPSLILRSSQPALPWPALLPACAPPARTRPPGPRQFTVPTGGPWSVISSQEPVITERVFRTTFRSKRAASRRRKRRLASSRRDPGPVAGP